MDIAGFLSKGVVHLFGRSAAGPAGMCVARARHLPAGGGAAWREQRLDRLECLCVAANAGLCCDTGPLIATVEAMERNCLAERKDRP